MATPAVIIKPALLIDVDFVREHPWLYSSQPFASTLSPDYPAFVRSSRQATSARKPSLAEQEDDRV